MYFSSRAVFSMYEAEGSIQGQEGKSSLGISAHSDLSSHIPDIDKAASSLYILLLSHNSRCKILTKLFQNQNCVYTHTHIYSGQHVI